MRSAHPAGILAGFSPGLFRQLVGFSPSHTARCLRHLRLIHLGDEAS